MEKALLDLIHSDYDDSAVLKCFDSMTDDEINSFKKYLKEVNEYEKISSDKRWSKYLK